MQAAMPISADSHVVEHADVFVGLAERFGDDAPRIVGAGTVEDSIVVPAKGPRGVRRRMGFAGMRKRDGLTLQRRRGHKPEVDDMRDDEAKRILAKGYDGLRAGIRDGAWRHEDQDEDGVQAEFLYPGFFGLFSFENTELLVACQKELQRLAARLRHRLQRALVRPRRHSHPRPRGRCRRTATGHQEGLQGRLHSLRRAARTAVQGRMLRAGLVACGGSELSPLHARRHQRLRAGAVPAEEPAAAGRNGQLRRHPRYHSTYAGGSHVPRRGRPASDAEVRGRRVQRRLDRALAGPRRSRPAARVPLQAPGIHRRTPARGLAAPVLRHHRRRPPGRAHPRDHRPGQPDVGFGTTRTWIPPGPAPRKCSTKSSRACRSPSATGSPTTT